MTPDRTNEKYGYMTLTFWRGATINAEGMSRGVVRPGSGVGFPMDVLAAVEADRR